MTDQTPGRTDRLRVRIVADPGLPTRRAHAVRDRLEQKLADTYKQDVSVQVQSDLLRVDQAHALDLETAGELSTRHGTVDVLLLLTEMPRYVDGRPLVAGAFPGYGVGVLSLPTLGMRIGTQRLLRVLTACAVRIAQVPGGESEEVRYPPHLGGARWSRRDDGSYALTFNRWTGATRMVMGMVLSNEPWRVVPRLSSAFAAAMATGAFGVFYSSIWQMSDALSVFRLALTAVVAVIMMVLWLVLRHRLWDSPRGGRPPGLVLLYNLSTGVTLTLAVVALYALLVLVILAASLIVIAPGFMGDVLGYPADFANYLKIAWFAAAMGVVAGALGTSFDDETAVRSLTHGQRERQRLAALEEAGDDAHRGAHPAAPPEDDGERPAT
ncbi:hypothetical protein BJF82_07590 [Kytococcus sp. CUA-901]|nr:hypothetical protein BJF82_07590 [Kytococcus sp. CUA-901]